jgi:hypothetical protein
MAKRSIPVPLLLLTAYAAVAWCVMFSPWTKQYVNFWAAMSVSAAILTTGTLIGYRRELARIFRLRPSHLAIGLASVPLLYGVFWLGNFAATQLFSFARPGVEGVYATSAQAPGWVIALLLLLLIGPAEEVFWRGYMLDWLLRRHRPWVALTIGAGIYTLVHIWSFNLMLIAAAAVAGLFWSLMYLRYRNLWPGIISHALWDALIFVWLPIS